MDPNVTTVFDLLIGLSGQINIKWIRSRLSISESTYRRYKNQGVWGDSLTQSDIRKLYDEAKLNYYNDDNQRFCDELLRLMGAMGISTVSFMTTFQREGYDAFINDVLERAYQNSEHSRRRSSGIKTATKSPSALKEKTPPSPRNTFTAFQRVRFFLSAACLVLLGLHPGLLYALFVWADSYPWVFVLLSVTIALSSVFLGCFVDAPLAWLRYRRKKETGFSWSAFVGVVRYGSPDSVLETEGRFNLSWPFWQYITGRGIFR